MRERLLVLAAALAACAHAGAAPEAWEAAVSPEAVARSAAPGATARYAPLIKSLRTSPEELGAPARNLRLPLKSFPDGRARVVLHAQEAWVSPDMAWLRGRGVRVVTLREDGSQEASLEAEEAAMDRASMLAVAKGRVRATRGGDRLAGVGALADLDAQYVKVLRRATVETRRLAGARLTERGMF